MGHTPLPRSSQSGSTAMNCASSLCLGWSALCMQRMTEIKTGSYLTPVVMTKGGICALRTVGRMTTALRHGHVSRSHSFGKGKGRKKNVK